MCQDGLPGTGLAGDRIEALAQPQLRPLDQQQILYPQLTQHVSYLAVRADRLSPTTCPAAHRDTGKQPALSTLTAGGSRLYAAAGSATASVGWTKSPERTRANPSTAATKQMMEPIRRISLKPLTKAVFATSTTWAR